MKFVLSTAVLLLFIGTSASAYSQEKGREEKEQGGHAQEAKPAQHQASRPAPQAKPAPQRQQTQARPAPQQHTQQAARPQQPRTQPVARAQQPSHSAVAARGGYAHGRISDAHYSASFGRGHSFHVNRGDYDHRRFTYGGYAFGFVDPWPVAWGYSDDVYVVYVDDGYYMYDRVHPGLRISLNIQ